MFDWDEANIAHIGWHGVEPYEAEEVFVDDGLIELPSREVEGEERRAITGATEAGRILTVIYTLRNGQVRVVSAFTPGKRDREAYQRRNP